MRFLLDSTTDTFVSVGIILFGLIVAIFTYYGIKKHNFGGNSKSKKSKGSLEVELMKK